MTEAQSSFAAVRVLHAVVSSPDAGDPLGSSGRDADEVRDVACDVTASSSVCSPPEVTDFEPRVSEVSGGAGGVGALGQLLVILLVLVLVAALAWIAWQMLANRSVADDEDDDEDDDADEPLESRDTRIVDERWPPDRWRESAADARAHGDFREAIRCEYRALVGDLARAGHVDEIPGRTSGEERAQVALIAPAGSDVAARFDEAADRFDRAWFDDAAVTAADDQGFAVAAAEVREVLRVGAGGAR